MSSIAKFDVEKFDGSNDFGLWRVKMRCLLIQHGWEAALDPFPETMADAEKTAALKTDVYKKAHSALLLCLDNKVLREVNKEDSAAGVWLKLETLYMTNTVYTTYSLNEISTYTGINTAYPGEWIRRIDFLYSFRSSEGNNIKLAIRNEKFEVICATCTQCLITANHDECAFKYVNNMNSSKKNQSANVSESTNQKKHKPNVKKSKKLGSEERLALPRPSKPKTCLRWLPTGRIFYLCGKRIASSNTEIESDTSVCDNASASNPQEPTSKGFPNSTSFLDSQNQRDLPRDTPIDRVEVLRTSRWPNYHIPVETHSRLHAHTQRSRKYSRLQSRLEESSEYQRYTSASSDKQELPQRTSMFQSRSIQVYLKAKDHDIKIKGKDIKIKIKIQDHKHAKGTAKEFLRIQGSKIQDVIRSEALCAMTTP
ncbi:hypothetical protein Tco_0212660 [Tanacetum coccineum]